MLFALVHIRGEKNGSWSGMRSSIALINVGWLQKIRKIDFRVVEELGLFCCEFTLKLAFLLVFKEKRIEFFYIFHA